MPIHSNVNSLNRACLLIPVLLLCPAFAKAGDGVSFRNDVMAVFSKAGCNQGACHGNQNGKNGFKLSLRGQDPEFDYSSLTHDMQGRRLNRYQPAESLILRKATATVPHEGGRRFGVDSPEYAILARWITRGVPQDDKSTPLLEAITVEPFNQIVVQPADRVQLHVQAAFSDGSRRDVSRLAVYEPANPIVTITPEGEVRADQPGETSILVRYLDQRVPVQLAFVKARPNFTWPSLSERNYIDHHVFKKLRSLQIAPSSICPDHVFMKRAFQDVLGSIPTADEARAFLSDRRPDKRAQLIESLLQRPEFADFWALKWSDILRNEEKTLDRKGVQVFHEWIRQSIHDGKPLDQFARELIAGQGNTYIRPEANFYRALREPQARAEAVAQVFLGVRLQCARCHNHPFDQWTQFDYHSWTAFFPRVQYLVLENNRKDKFDKHEFDGDQVVYQTRTGETRHPRTGEPLAPKLLGAKTPSLDGPADRLQAVAAWVGSPDNALFTRTQANRIWFHLFGRGIVEPNDDFRQSNPPSNGALLSSLSTDFADHHCDLRHMIRTIMNSATYHLSAVPNETNRNDESNFSHASVKPLQAEQLLDAIAKVTGAPVRFSDYPAGFRAVQLPGVQTIRPRGQRPTQGEQFMQRFGKPERLLSCECERSDDTTLNQAFQLLTGDVINQQVSRADNRIGRWLSQGYGDEQLVHEMYLTALARLPTAQELEKHVNYLESRNRRQAAEDLLWALLNSKEFLLRW